MSTEFLKKIKVFAIQLAVFSAFLFGIHSYIFMHIGSEMTIILPLWQIYIFLTAIVFIIYAWILYQYTKGKTEVFNYFMIGTMAKMILAMIFLLPVFLSDMESKRPDVFNFFIPYFIFLALEVFLITKLLNQKTEKIEE